MRDKKLTLKSLSLEDMGDGTTKTKMIETFKKAGFVERDCKCGRWYMRHSDDDGRFCPICASSKCLPPHLNN
jgi:hypothetical protein